METEKQARNAFSPALIYTLIAVGVFSFCAFFVLAAYAPVMRSGNDGGQHALSRSAVGFAFLSTLMKETGAPVLAPRGERPNAPDGVVVLTPKTISQFNDASFLNTQQTTIVIAPKWNVVPDPNQNGWVKRVGVQALSPLELETGDEKLVFSLERESGNEGLRLQTKSALGRAILSDTGSPYIGDIDHLQTLEPDDALEAILETGDGRILIAKIRGFSYYIVSDPDLANTHGLKNRNRAALMAAFLNRTRSSGPVVFDLSLHGIERTRNIIRLALEPPFLAATLAAFLTALLLGLKAAARFGPPLRSRRAFEAGKTALADNSAALIRMADREAAFTARYAALIRKQIGKALSPSRALSASALDSLLDRLGKERANAAFTEIRREAGETDTPADAVRAAQRLYKFKQEVLRGHQ